MKGIHSLLMGYHDLFDCYFQCSFLDISKIVERFFNFQLQYGYCSGSEYYPYYITVQTICCLCFMYRKKNQKNITACKTTKLKMYIHFFFPRQQQESDEEWRRYCVEYSEKGKHKACRNETCYIDYNFADFAVGVHHRKQII